MTVFSVLVLCYLNASNDVCKFATSDARSNTQSRTNRLPHLLLLVKQSI